jgi:SNF2 family DNA or RNA helicase
MAEVDALLEVLGAANVSREAAARLLERHGGSAERAAAAFFAGGEDGGGQAAAAGDDGDEENGGGPQADPALRQLRRVLGAGPTDAALRRLLADNGNSAERAADAFFAAAGGSGSGGGGGSGDQPEPATAPAANENEVNGRLVRRRRRRARLEAGDDAGEEAEEEEDEPMPDAAAAAAAAAPPPAPRRRPSSAAQEPGGGAARRRRGLLPTRGRAPGVTVQSGPAPAAPPPATLPVAGGDAAAAAAAAAAATASAGGPAFAARQRAYERAHALWAARMNQRHLVDSATHAAAADRGDALGPHALLVARTRADSAWAREAGEAARRAAADAANNNTPSYPSWLPLAAFRRPADGALFAAAPDDARRADGADDVNPWWRMRTDAASLRSGGGAGGAAGGAAASTGGARPSSAGPQPPAPASAPLSAAAIAAAGAAAAAYPTSGGGGAPTAGGGGKARGRQQQPAAAPPTTAPLSSSSSSKDDVMPTFPVYLGHIDLWLAPRPRDANAGAVALAADLVRRGCLPTEMLALRSAHWHPRHNAWPRSWDERAQREQVAAGDALRRLERDPPAFSLALEAEALNPHVAGLAGGSFYPHIPYYRPLGGGGGGGGGGGAEAGPLSSSSASAAAHPPVPRLSAARRLRDAALPWAEETARDMGIFQAEMPEDEWSRHYGSSYWYSESRAERARAEAAATRTPLDTSLPPRCAQVEPSSPGVPASRLPTPLQAWDADETLRRACAGQGAVALGALAAEPLPAAPTPPAPPGQGEGGGAAAGGGDAGPSSQQQQQPPRAPRPPGAGGVSTAGGGTDFTGALADAVRVCVHRGVLRAAFELVSADGTAVQPPPADAIAASAAAAAVGADDDAPQEEAAAPPPKKGAAAAKKQKNGAKAADEEQEQEEEEPAPAPKAGGGRRGAAAAASEKKAPAVKVEPAAAATKKGKKRGAPEEAAAAEEPAPAPGGKAKKASGGKKGAAAAAAAADDASPAPTHPLDAAAADARGTAAEARAMRVRLHLFLPRRAFEVLGHGPAGPSSSTAAAAAPHRHPHPHHHATADANPDPHPDHTAQAEHVWAGEIPGAAAGQAAAAAGGGGGGGGRRGRGAGAGADADDEGGGVQKHVPGMTPSQVRSLGRALHSVLLAVLLRGEGLALGPDSDALINADPDRDAPLKFLRAERARGAARRAAAAAAGAAGTAGAAAAASSPPPPRQQQPNDDAGARYSPEDLMSVPPRLFNIEALLEAGRLPPDYKGLELPRDEEDEDEEDEEQQAAAAAPPATTATAAAPPTPEAARLADALLTQPKPFQLQGVAWMLRRENGGDARGRGHLRVHPLWAQLVALNQPPGTVGGGGAGGGNNGSDGSNGAVSAAATAPSLRRRPFVFYAHRLEPCRLMTRLPAAPAGVGTCGGLLCDEMGLGKTLQVLMLAVAHPPPGGWAAGDPRQWTPEDAPEEGLPMPPLPGERPAPPPAGTSKEAWARSVAEAGAAVEEARAAPPPCPVRCTLVVAPANLLPQWAGEVRRHLRAGALKWGVYQAAVARRGGGTSGGGGEGEGGEGAADDGAPDAAATTGGARRTTRILKQRHAEMAARGGAATAREAYLKVARPPVVWVTAGEAYAALISREERQAAAAAGRRAAAAAAAAGENAATAAAAADPSSDAAALAAAAAEEERERERAAREQEQDPWYLGARERRRRQEQRERASRRRREERERVAAERDAALAARVSQDDIVPLHDCDFVLMSYETLRSELSRAVAAAEAPLKKSGGGKDGDASSALPPLLRYGFWRICLDEAQNVANSSSVAAVTASMLYRRHAWTVTGTPLSQNAGEVRGLAEFLAAEPFHRRAAWRSLLAEPHAQGQAAGPASFRSLLSGVLLRREKRDVAEQLALPPCERLDVRVHLSTAERAFYSQLEQRFSRLLSVLRDRHAHLLHGNGPAPGARTPAGQLAAQASATLTALRQAAIHPLVAGGAASLHAADATGGLGGGGGGGGGSRARAAAARMSMRDIMATLVGRALADVDAAAAEVWSLRLAGAAAKDWASGDATMSGARAVAAAARRVGDASAALVDAAPHAVVRGSDGGLLASAEAVVAAAASVAGDAEEGEGGGEGGEGGSSAEAAAAAARILARVPAGAARQALADAKAEREEKRLLIEAEARRERLLKRRERLRQQAAKAAAGGGGGGNAPSPPPAAQPAADANDPSASAARKSAEPPAADDKLSLADLEAMDLDEPLCTLTHREQELARGAEDDEDEQRRRRDARNAAVERARRWVHLEHDALTLETYVLPRLGEALVLSREAEISREWRAPGRGGAGTGALGSVRWAAGAAGGRGGGGRGGNDDDDDDATASADEAGWSSDEGGGRVGDKRGRLGQDAGADGARKKRRVPARRVLPPRGAPASGGGADEDDGNAPPSSNALAAAHDAAADARLLLGIDVTLGIESMRARGGAGGLRKSRRRRGMSVENEGLAANAGGGGAGGGGRAAGAAAAAAAAAEAQAAADAADPAGAAARRATEAAEAAEAEEEAAEAVLRAQPGVKAMLGLLKSAAAWKPPRAEPAGVGGGAGGGGSAAAPAPPPTSAADRVAVVGDGSGTDRRLSLRAIESVSERAIAQAQRVIQPKMAALRHALAQQRAMLDAAAGQQRHAELELARRAAETRCGRAAREAEALRDRLETEARLAREARRAERGEEGEGEEGGAAAAAEEAAAEAALAQAEKEYQAAAKAAAEAKRAVEEEEEQQEGEGGGKGKTAAAGGGDNNKKDASHQQKQTCPVCLDAPLQWTVTACGHAFCTDCAHNVVDRVYSLAACPVCRHPLRPEDLFDQAPAGEGVEKGGEKGGGGGKDGDGAGSDAALAAAASADTQEFGDYGSKIAALLRELRAMGITAGGGGAATAAATAAPPSRPNALPPRKAVVFSAWGRSLRLVGSALSAMGVGYGAMLGGDPSARQRALQRFLDPHSDCRVLLLQTSHASGAAGLTLTVADTAFLLEPALSPGLEAQAAARVHRMGQRRAARVVRFVAARTVDERVLDLQAHRLAGGQQQQQAGGDGGGAAAGGAGGGAVAAEACDFGTLVSFFDPQRDRAAEAAAVAAARRR